MVMSCSRRSALVIRIRPDRRGLGSVTSRSRQHHAALRVSLEGFYGQAALRVRTAESVRRASRRSLTGQRTSLSQPIFSKNQMHRADVSSCPLSTPCRAQVGSEWCRLCHDSPWLRIASHHTLPDLSRLLNGRSPIVWQIELIDQVTWCSSAMRTRLAQKNAVSAPEIDQDQRPPMTAGARSETATSSGNIRDTLTMSLSLSRSGAYCRCGVCSVSNNQPTCAWMKPLVSPASESPYFHGLCGSPSRSENLWCLR